MEKRWREENERIMREHPVNQMQALLDAPSSPAVTGDEAPAEADDAPPELVAQPETAPAAPAPDKPDA